MMTTVKPILIILLYINVNISIINIGVFFKTIIISSIISTISINVQNI